MAVANSKLYILNSTLAILTIAMLFGCKQYDDYIEEIVEPEEVVEPEKPVERFNMDDIPTIIDGRAAIGSPGNRDIYLWGGTQDTMMLYTSFYTGVMSINTEVLYANTDISTGQVTMKASGMGAVPLVLLAENPAQNDTVICHVRNIYGSSWVACQDSSLPKIRRFSVLENDAATAILDSINHGLFCDTTSRYSFWDDFIVCTQFLGGTETQTQKYLFSWSEDTQSLRIATIGYAKEYKCEVLLNKADSLRIALVCDETDYWETAFPEAWVSKVISVQYLDRIALNP